MGLIRGIAEAVMEKAKHEVKDYLIKFMEEEKEKEKKTEEIKKEEIPAAVLKESVKAEELKEEDDEDEEILPLIESEFTKFTYKVKPKDFTIPGELADIIKMLPVEEFACFVKLMIFVFEQKKNFGYIGNTLRRKIGLESFENEKFDKTVENLEKYGVLKVEQVSDNQKTFILYVPFDEETMVKAEYQKPEKTQQKKVEKKPVKKGDEEEKPVEKQNDQQDDIPGKAVFGMENDDLYKSYRTFVSLEIDKAKMRVGRSNFDKIYMEAVKYIDKKYGFKVLSDSEKFKEYLTNYYISAFDIPTFESWKKTKV
ncbi:MAG TPA: hypothetical protein PLX56_06490 [bacterium]|nr:hypothetical protein [bacterium]HQO91959.1 hypothetical protein [bacterium]